MSDLQEGKVNTELPRLSRTSVFMPTFVTSSSNPGARKHSDTIDISPLASQVRLSISEADDTVGEEDGEATPMPPGLGKQGDNEYLQDLFPGRKDRNDSTSTSATGPAGSGMPPAETAFTCEKEVVEEETVLEMPSQQRISRASLIGRTYSEPHIFSRSPESKIVVADVIGLPDAGNSVPEGPPAAIQAMRLRSSFNSESSLNTFGSQQSTVAEKSNVLYQTAQTARLKHSSTSYQYGHSGLGSDLSNMNRFILSRDDYITDTAPINRSQSVAIGSISREKPRMGIDDKFGPHVEEDVHLTSDANVLAVANPPNTPSLAQGIGSKEKIEGDPDKLTLRDALRIKPFGSSSVPKRSTTVPASFGVRRKARFSLLPLQSHPVNIFRRESVVSTPYPKAEEELAEACRDKEQGELLPEREDIIEAKPSVLGLVVLVRKNVGRIMVPLHENMEGEGKRPLKQNSIDDERLMKILHKEFVHLQGRARNLMGAKTAKAVRVNLIRTGEVDIAPSDESSSFRGYFGSYAESDFWKLWCDPSIGHKRRNWLGLLVQKSKMISSEWTIAVEILEGHDAARIIVAFSVITAVSLMAMFFWLFLGVGGEGNTMTIVDGTVLRPTSMMEDTAGRVGDSFLFGMWVLFIGWTGVAGWVFVS